MVTKSKTSLHKNMSSITHKPIRPPKPKSPGTTSSFTPTKIPLHKPKPDWMISNRHKDVLSLDSHSHTTTPALQISPNTTDMPPLQGRTPGNWSLDDHPVPNSVLEPSSDDRSIQIQPYGLITTVLTAIPVGIIIFIIVAGNALVIAAVLRDSRLKRQVQNWLIVSVAAADLFVGLLIMPFTLTYELLDQWVLGDILCELWLALDVLFVTASILNLCAISLDRYWSLTYPTTYPQKRTPRLMLIMIVVVWLMAFAISFPPLVGWRPENRAASACFLSDQLGYVLYSSLGSFFIPTLVLFSVYARIYCITRKRSSKRKKPMYKPPFFTNATVANTTSLLHKTSVPTIIEPPKTTSVGHRDRLGGDLSGSNSFNEAQEATRSSLANPRPSNDFMFTDNDYAVLIAKIRSIALTGRNGSIISNDGTLDSSSGSPEHQPGQNRALSIVASIANEAATHSRQQREDPLALKALELRKQLIQRQKLVRRRERQATLVLGLVLGAFIGSWMPFFCSYLLSGFGLRTPDLLFDVIFWLGYCNSGLNPFIYNFFNPDFRRAFRKILSTPMDKLRTLAANNLLLGGDRRRSSSAATLMGTGGQRRKATVAGSLMPLRHSSRRGAVFSPKHPYLQVQQRYEHQCQRDALMGPALFENNAMIE